MRERERERVVLYWSGGKDSAAALHELSTRPRYAGYQVASLLTTFTTGYDRVTGHGVRRALIEAQAAMLGIQLIVSYIPQCSTMTQYEEITEAELRTCRAAGARWAASGDIFVEKQRLAQLARVELASCQPLWKRTSRWHAERLLDLGIKAYVVCVQDGVLDPSFAGRELDRDFLRDLPTGVDPCGENGEYHTFAYDGPSFSQPIACRTGRVVRRDGFYFCDVLLAQGQSRAREENPR
jgi:uncharacterized protein (TIGR00290 family)